MGSPRLARVLPYCATGRVVHGFGRGSKQLGCPTANLDEATVQKLPELLEPGVYYGWAKLDSQPVRGMVMSIGWNPHYHNTKKTMEVHILHDFGSDFYGSLLRVLIVGFVREMCSFKNLDELIAAIESDKRVARERLALTDSLKLKLSVEFDTPLESRPIANGVAS